MNRATFFITTFILAAGTAFASDAVIDHRCFAGSLSYSPGATIGAADGVFECTAEGTWAPSNRGTFGCVAEGVFFSVGVSYQKGASTPMFECTSRGVWEASAE